MSTFFAILLYVVLFIAGPAHAEPSPMNIHQDNQRLSFMGNDMVAIASRYVGKTAAQIGLPRRLWCGDFLNYIRQKAGLKPSPSRRAADQRLNAIVLSRPEPGSIMIHGRRGGSHAGLIVAVLGDGKVETIEGNVSGRVERRVVPLRGKIIKPK